ncbi:hypothetical protein CASFOL_042231 [Castilleja foliolosa]|uniref:CCHC-type domain-containing protein n=1 Tax=Castilleja foliolosa TaxID=1961234 RepID=A0ABD3B9Z2_9LAMI
MANSMSTMSVASVGQPSQNKRQLVCHHCQQLGHCKAECPSLQQQSQRDPITCFNCGKVGHINQAGSSQGASVVQQPIRNVQTGGLSSGGHSGAQGRMFTLASAPAPVEETPHTYVAQGTFLL